jgi:hypothetical protein
MNHASCKEWNNNDSVFDPISNNSINKRTSHNRNKPIEIQTADRSTRAGPSTTGEALLCFTPALEKWNNSELLY